MPRRKEMEEKGQHDAQSIYCEEKKAENRFEISYRFGVKDKQGEPMPIALVWDIDLGLKDGIVNSIDPRVSIMTP